ncbi:MAG: insulinase family protein, partial [Lachnospiraceae bacterium]|nr:insulinase family protein [Lachnospiraceae bacterium]
EIEKLIRDTNHLKAYQEEPSSREDIEKIPMLKREDMKKEAMPFLNEERNCENLPVLYHNIFSNGILYLNFLFDICFVSQEDLPYLGILKAVLGYMDTKQYSYGDLADEINLETGGMSASISVYPSIADDTSYEA